MPHPTGPRPDLTLAQKAVLKTHFARSYAISSNHNRRNLEFPWYSLWCHTLTHLVEEFADFIVCPQYTIYLTRESPDCGEEEEDDTLREEDFPDLAERPTRQPSGRRWNDGTVNVDEPDSADTSFSTIGTQPDKNADTLITDFAVIQVFPKRVDVFRGRYGGWRILQVAVPILVENKRHTERKLRGNERVADILPLLHDAMDGVETQAAYAFQKHPHMESLIGIASCGPWWTCAVLTPSLVQKCLDLEFRLRTRESPKMWERMLKLNTNSSNQRLQELQKTLQGMSKTLPE